MRKETGTDGWRMYMKDSKEVSQEYRELLERKQNKIENMVIKELEKRGLR